MVTPGGQQQFPGKLPPPPPLSYEEKSNQGNRETAGDKAADQPQKTQTPDTLPRPPWLKGRRTSGIDPRVFESVKNAWAKRENDKNQSQPRRLVNSRTSSTKEVGEIADSKPLKIRVLENSSEPEYRKNTEIFHRLVPPPPPSKPLSSLPRHHAQNEPVNQGLPPPPSRQQMEERRVPGQRKTPHPPPGPAPLANRPKASSPSQSPSVNRPEQKQPAPPIVLHPIDKLKNGLLRGLPPYEFQEIANEVVSVLKGKDKGNIDAFDRVVQDALQDIKKKDSFLAKRLEIRRPYIKNDVPLKEGKIINFLSDLERFHSLCAGTFEINDSKECSTAIKHRANQLKKGIIECTDHAKKYKETAALVLAKSWELNKELEKLKELTKNSSDKGLKKKLNSIHKDVLETLRTVGCKSLETDTREELRNKLKEIDEGMEHTLELKDFINKKPIQEIAQAIMNEIMDGIINPNNLLKGHDHKMLKFIKKNCPGKYEKLSENMNLKRLLHLRLGNIEDRIPLDFIPKQPTDIPDTIAIRNPRGELGKANKVMKEILDTETTLVRGIAYIRDSNIFQDLITDQREFLESGWEDLQKSGATFLNDLKFLGSDDKSTSEKVKHCIQQFTSKNFTTHIKALSSQAIKTAEMTKILRKDEQKNKEKLDQFEQGSPGKQNLNSILVQPAQRMPRYRMLLEELGKQLKKQVPEEGNEQLYTALTKAIDYVDKYTQAMNETLRAIES